MLNLLINLSGIAKHEAEVTSHVSNENMNKRTTVRAKITRNDSNKASIGRKLLAPHGWREKARNHRLEWGWNPTGTECCSHEENRVAAKDSSTESQLHLLLPAGHLPSLSLMKRIWGLTALGAVSDIILAYKAKQGRRESPNPATGEQPECSNTTSYQTAGRIVILAGYLRTVLSSPL